MEKLKKIYTNPKSPAGFSGIQKLYEEAKKQHPEITLKDVRHFMEGNRTYTLFKPRRVNYARSKIIPTGYLSDLHVDLGDFQALAKDNDNYRFLLVAVDVLSKMLYLAPVKSKTAKDMKEAFEIVFKQMEHLPGQIFSDKGNEFESREMKQYFKEKAILKFCAKASHIKAAVAERFIRTVKERLYRYFSEKNTTKWVKAVQQIREALNNSKSAVTGFRPIDVSSDNAKEIWDNVYRKHVMQEGKEPKYSKNDAVRISRAKPIFEKGV